MSHNNGGYQRYAMDKYEKLSVDEVNGWAILADESRGLSKRAAEHFGVRSQMCEKTGEKIVKTAYPYFNQLGHLSGYKVKEWDTGNYQAVGVVNIGCKLFGQQTHEDGVVRRKKIIITEGEGDAVAAWEAMMKTLDGSPYSGKINPCVVSIQLGTTNAVSGLSANELYVKDFDKIVIAFDMDKATPQEAMQRPPIIRGSEAKESVAAYLQTEVFEVKYATGSKDARDMYCRGLIADLGKLLSFGETRYTPEKVYSMADLDDDFLLQKRPDGYMTNVFPKLDGMLRGFRKKTLVIVTAPSGAGKSTVLHEIGHQMALQGLKIGKISLEEEMQETALQCIGRRVEINPHKFKEDPIEHIAEKIKHEIDSDKLAEEKWKVWREAKEWANDKYSFIDHFGSLTCEVLLNKIKHLEHVEKCDFIFLDHLSMIFSGTVATDERRLIDNIMTEMTSYVATSNVGIIAVSHMKRKEDPPFPKENGEEMPVWVKITKQDLRGSGSLEQLSFVVIAVEPELMPDRSRGRIRLVVLKNRPASTMGIADTLRMDSDTGVLYSVPDDEF